VTIDVVAYIPASTRDQSVTPTEAEKPTFTHEKTPTATQDSTSVPPTGVEFPPLAANGEEQVTYPYQTERRLEVHLSSSSPASTGLVAGSLAIVACVVFGSVAIIALLIRRQKQQEVLSSALIIA
jgi:hypothetical protein